METSDDYFFFIAAIKRSAMSEGVSATAMPASRNAAILPCGGAFAAADDRAGVAHAASGRRGGAGDEAGDRLLAVLLRPRGGFFLGVAADFADHDDRLGFGVVVEHLACTSRWVVPLTGSPPMPTQVLWP